MTKILQAQPKLEKEHWDLLEQALDRGELVILPTETVYGIAARADRPEAMSKLRNLKGPERPFTLHLGSSSQIPDFEKAPIQARRIAKNYWPGPLTLILDQSCRNSIAEAIGATQTPGSSPSVGYRVVDHPETSPLLARFEHGLPMSSANLPDQPAPRTLEEVDPKLMEAAALVLEAGPCRSGISSSVLKIPERGPIQILRNGTETPAQLLARAATLHLFVCTGNTCRSPMAALLYHQHLAARLGIPPQSLLEHGHIVSSAGISALPGVPASPHAIQAMADLGLDLSYHRSRPADPVLLARASRIYCMGSHHLAFVNKVLQSMGGSLEEDALPPRLLLEGRDIPDPFGGPLALYIETREALREAFGK